MKKVVLAQIVLLLCTVLLGLSLKTGMLPISSDIHKLFGMTAGLVGIVVLILAFLNKLPMSVKALALAALLLTGSAAIGGSALESTTNYNFYYGQMAVSGILALFVSIFLYFKIRSQKSLK